MPEEPSGDWKDAPIEYGRLLYKVLWHSIFTVIVVAFNVGVERGVEYLQPHGVEAIFFRAVQLCFGAATLCPVLIFVVRDVSVHFFRALKAVEEERKRKRKKSSKR